MCTGNVAQWYLGRKKHQRKTQKEKCYLIKNILNHTCKGSLGQNFTALEQEKLFKMHLRYKTFCSFPDVIFVFQIAKKNHALSKL